MGWETIFYFYQKWVDRNFAIIAKISLGLRKVRYAIAIFIVSYAGSCGYYSIGHCSLHPASYILQLAIFFLFSPSFEILHSRIAEIDIRPYEIDGNQPDFG